ncbi:MAG: VanZ family protein [Spirochaetales bacterium]|nr:VanZ family protein [Spirochaetales bacterium]
MMDYLVSTISPVKLLPSYLAAIAVLVISLVIVWKIKDDTIPDNVWAFPFLAATMIMILSETLLCREAGSEFQYIVKPFYSYIQLVKGDESRSGEIALNILMMIPFGLFLGIFISIDLEFWDFHLFQTVISGFIFSLLIELVQLISKRGTFEIDDMINNTIGALIGYLLALVLMRIKENMDRG